MLRVPLLWVMLGAVIASAVLFKISADLKRYEIQLAYGTPAVTAELLQSIEWLHELEHLLLAGAGTHGPSVADEGLVEAFSASRARAYEVMAPLEDGEYPRFGLSLRAYSNQAIEALRLRGAARRETFDSLRQHVSVMIGEADLVFEAAIARQHQETREQAHNLHVLRQSVDMLLAIAPFGMVAVLVLALREHGSRQQREEAEYRARWWQQELADAVAGLRDGFALFDHRARLVVANSRFQRLWGDGGHDFVAGTPYDKLVAQANPDPALHIDLVCALPAGGCGDGEPATIDIESDVSLGGDRWLRKRVQTTGTGGTVGLFTDISELKRRERALAASEARFRVLAETSPIGIWHLSEGGRSRYANPAMLDMLETDSSEGLACAPFLPELFDGDAAHGWCGRSQPCSQLETTLLGQSGARRTVLVSMVALPGHVEGEQGGCLLTVMDITERKNAEARLAHLAHHDPLTGLANRLLFFERFERATLEMQRERRRFAVLALDLDLFKRVNDTLGHAAGDDLLCQVADRLRAGLRATDTIARLGGDEFSVLLKPLADEADARQIADKLVASLSEPYDLQGRHAVIGCSIGIALFPQHGTTPKDLLQAADYALYQVKASGRGRTAVFRPALARRFSTSETLAKELADALHGEALGLRYRPVVRLDRWQPSALAADLVWCHAEREVVRRDDIIACARESHLVDRVSFAVGGMLARDSAELHARGSDLAVSLSAEGLNLLALLEGWRAAAGREQARGVAIEIAIAETALLDHESSADSLIAQIHKSGARLTLDDFGTGQASLDTLRRWPVDGIRLDAVFARDMSPGSREAAIIGALITMAQRLGIEVVAKGIENAQQVALLHGLGCQFGQGRLFGEADRLAACLAQIEQSVATERKVVAFPSG